MPSSKIVREMQEQAACRGEPVGALGPAAPQAQVDRSGGSGKRTFARSTLTFDTIATGPEVVHRPRVLVGPLGDGLREDTGGLYLLGPTHAADDQPARIARRMPLRARASVPRGTITP